jgi:hypothetical protein
VINMNKRARMLAAIAIATLVSSSSLLPQLHAQTLTANATQTPRVESDRTPRVELFLGYSRFGVGLNSTSGTAGNRMVGLNGGTASLAYNFNRFFALAADVGGYDDSQLQLTGTGANQPRTVNSSGTAFTYLGGPRFTVGRQHRVSLFVQALAGGVHASAVIVSNCTGAACTALPSQNAFAMTGGGGVDVRLTHLLSLRLVQAEYMRTRFAAVPSGVSASQNDLRLSAGLVFRFGGNRQPAPPAPTAAAEVPAPPAAAVVASPEPPPAPPTISCSANPQSIASGGTSQITASAASAHHGTLLYTYSASDGTIAGNNATAVLTAAGSSPGVITVTCNVTDDLGAAASANTTVDVIAPPAVVAPQHRDLCAISFERDRKRPVRVDNEAKACLDDIALTLQRDPEGRLVILGDHDEAEKPEVGMRRATNEKQYLVRDKGIDAERIDLKPGLADGRKATNVFLPAGVTF